MAEFRFLDEGKFMGTMYWDCCGEFNLVGIKNESASRNRAFAKMVPEWKEKYYMLTEANYDYECVARWGTWVKYPDEKRERNSDTEVSGDESGHEDEDEDEEDKGVWKGKGRRLGGG